MKKIIYIIILLFSFAFFTHHKLAILANLGVAEAQYSLANEYFEGRNGHVERKKALDWCKRAAINGNPNAQYRMGEEEENELLEGNSKNAFEWFYKAASQGHADAMIKIGEMYNTGTGVIKDEAKAVDFFLKAIAQYETAANSGDAAAASKLGDIFGEGHIIAKDPNQAFKWEKKAANMGKSYCQLRLAHYFETGEGTNVNLLEAYKWYSLAAVNAQDELCGEVARTDRDRIEKLLSPEQIITARELARNWQPSND